MRLGALVTSLVVASLVSVSCSSSHDAPASVATSTPVRDTAPLSTISATETLAATAPTLAPAPHLLPDLLPLSCRRRRLSRSPQFPS